ncbi:MAG: TIGR01777 family oxidoreductase [Nitriliruptoraceae bacterium]
MARYAITGATGLLGGALRDALTADGHTVHGVTRDPARAGADDIVWDPDAGSIQAEKLEGVEVVVHLAAKPIRAERVSEEARRAIRGSRVEGTGLLAETLAGLDQKPNLFLSGSAVGYYGDRGDEVLTEESGPGDDFLAEVCQAWEAAAQPARDAGIRTIHPRTGVVIAKDGPLIEKIELPFRLGVGGRVGDGRQYVPWISLTDHVRAMRFLAESLELSGPVNLTAPEPVTNREMTKALGAVFRRPTVFLIPPIAMRLLYGEMGETLATVSARAVPERLLEAGFEFTHTDIRAALEEALLESDAA